jgi:aryl-alcohol dehydrogenase-like predicted oxidoreductase
MQYRPLGNSSLTVSALTLGTWAMGGFMWGGSDAGEAVAAIQKAVDLGVTGIDTAPIYGLGGSEEIIGKAIAGRRDRVQLLTKFGLCWDKAAGAFHFETRTPNGEMVKVYRNARRQRVIAECESSLKRLGTDYIDLYQQHWPDPETPLEETWEAVAQLLKAGKIRAAGVSNFSLEQIEQAGKMVPLASVQPPYSMINRGIEKDLLPYCRKHRLGVLVYSPLQRGLLTGKITLEHEFPATDHRRTNPFFKYENRRKVLGFLKQITPIAEAHRATLAQLVISWTINRPGITGALVGARNVRQAEENAKGAELVLSEEETGRIERLLETLELEL